MPLVAIVSWFAAGLLFVSTAHAEPRPGVVVPVSDTRFSGFVVKMESDGRIVFQADGKERTFAPNELVSFGAYTDGEKGPLVLLADGSTLAVASLDQLTTRHLDVTTDLWGELHLPLGAVRGIVFRPPAMPLDRDKLLARLHAARGDEDQLLLENGDLVSGQIKSEAAALGPLAPGDEPEAWQSVRLETKAGPAILALEKLLALAFNPALVEAPRAGPPPTWVGLRDGTLMAAAKLTSSDGKTRLALAGGVSLTAPVDEFLEELTWLQPLSADVTYLSDLKPTAYKHIPFLAVPWSYGVDQNLLGGRLRSGGAAYAKGLAMHSTSRLAYRLDGRYRRLQADLALDNSAGTRGSVLYRVFVEREAGQWEAAFESPVIRGDEPPLPISVDISGAQRIALIVEFADHGDELDHANWLNARLIARTE